MSNPDSYMQPGDLVPRPDPTILTTAAVDRALANYREIVDTRLGGMDKAIELVAEASTRRLVSEREFQASQVDTLTASIAALDRRVSEQFNGQQTALAAALASQEKAVAAALAAAEKAVSAALTAADKAVDARQTSAEREFHEHLDQYRHEVDFAFQASDRAITKAETATEKRFEGVNEFRAQLTEQAATFMPRAEAEGSIARNAERIRDISEQNATFVRRAEIEPAREQMNTRIAELAARLDRMEGRGAGLASGWGYILGGIAALSAVVALYFALRGA
jgi:hypothetical protein